MVPGWLLLLLIAPDVIGITISMWKEEDIYLTGIFGAGLFGLGFARRKRQPGIPVNMLDSCPS